MARVTVEDCAEVVQNRFELVALASHRAKSISSGAPLTVERDNDKNSVVSLREIAKRTVSTSDLHDSLTKSHQENADIDQKLKEEFDRDSKGIGLEKPTGAFAEEMSATHDNMDAEDNNKLLYGGDDVEDAD